MIFNLLAFVMPSEKTTTFWIAYAFSVLAFLSQIFLLKIFKRKDALKDKKFIGFSSLHIGFAYLSLQIVSFFLFKALFFLPPFVSIIVCSIIFGIFLSLQIFLEMAKNEIVAVEERVEEKVLFIKKLQIEAEIALKKETDYEVKKDLQRLVKTIRFSDPMSNSELIELEEKIKDKVNNFALSSNKKVDICEIEALLYERNKKCKILK